MRQILTAPLNWVYNALDNIPAPIFTPDPPTTATGARRTARCVTCDVTWNANALGERCWCCTRQGAIT